MMVAIVELAVDLWTFGLPVVLLVAAILRARPATPPRARYLIVIAGFVIALALPLSAVIPTLSEAEGEGPGGMGGTTVPSIAAECAQSIKVPFSAVWLAGILLLLSRDIVGHVRLRVARRGWRPAPEELKEKLAWPEDVDLLISYDAPPMTAGLIRPRVVLPSNLTDRRIALHELSHARWRDPLVNAALRAVAAVFWVAPVWPLLRWARREREAAADEMALRGTTEDPASYIEALLHLSRATFDRHVLASTMAESDLEYRARRILTPARSGSALAVFVVLAAGGLVAANTKPADFSDRGTVSFRRSIRTIENRIEKVVSEPVRPARRGRKPALSLPSSRHLDVALTPAKPDEPQRATARPPHSRRDDGREVIVIRQVIRN